MSFCNESRLTSKGLARVGVWRISHTIEMLQCKCPTMKANIQRQNRMLANMYAPNGDNHFLLTWGVHYMLQVISPVEISISQLRLSAGHPSQCRWLKVSPHPSTFSIAGGQHTDNNNRPFAKRPGSPPRIFCLI